jgi:hypothetical protein
MEPQMNANRGPLAGARRCGGASAPSRHTAHRTRRCPDHGPHRPGSIRR